MKRILVIDDDPLYRKVMGEILQQHGWEVFEANEGETGIELAKAHHPDAVLCDLLMPRSNGFQVCRALRANPALHGMRIIVTSGRQFESDRQAALVAGADDYLVKPVEVSDLLSALSPLAEKDRTAAQPSSTAVQGSYLRFWGVRGSIPTPGPGTIRYGGNTSCVEVRICGKILILDAGTGLRLLGQQLAVEFNNQPLDLTLLLTHTHWDHIQGLPFFLPVYQPESHLRILGYEGARHGLDNVLTSQMESPYFPVNLREVPGNIQIEELKDLNFKIGDIRVEAWFANHPGICVGYKLFTPGGTIVFFPDNESYSSHWHAKSKTSTAMAGLEFARQEQQKLSDFVRGADILIMDAQYNSEEYQKHVGWGHGCLDDVVDLAVSAEVKRLFLFHHDPDHDDAAIDQMVRRAQDIALEKQSALEVEAAREGAIVELERH